MAAKTGNSYTALPLELPRYQRQVQEHKQTGSVDSMALYPGLPIFTKFCVLVGVLDVFLSFEFQKDQAKIESCGGRNFPSGVEKAHRLYNSLLLP